MRGGDHFGERGCVENGVACNLLEMRHNGSIADRYRMPVLSMLEDEHSPGALFLGHSSFDRLLNLSEFVGPKR
jgi:hypothetical protein